LKQKFFVIGEAETSRKKFVTDKKVGVDF